MREFLSITLWNVVWNIVHSHPQLTTPQHTMTSSSIALLLCNSQGRGREDIVGNEHHRWWSYYKTTILGPTICYHHCPLWLVVGSLNTSKTVHLLMTSKYSSHPRHRITNKQMIWWHECQFLFDVYVKTLWVPFLGQFESAYSSQAAILKHKNI